MELIIKQNKKLRDINYIRIVIKKINSYIKKPKGSLNLDNTPIHVLPKNLKYIDDDLYIENTNIAELPDDIFIFNHLWCYNTPLSKKYSTKEIKSKYNIKGMVCDFNF